MLASGYSRSRGRTLGGTTTVYTKSKVSKKVIISYSKSLNNLCGLTMTVGIHKDTLSFKMAAVLLTMDSSISYVPLTRKMYLFRIVVAAKLARIAVKRGANFKLYRHRFCELISMLDPLDRACFVSARSTSAPAIAKSSGESVVIISKKRQTRKTGVVVKLPSYKLKVIDSLSLVLMGAVLVARKLLFKNTKAGYWRRLGVKPTTRGVAKNPVDHPHGGRENTILWPRTP